MILLAPAVIGTSRKLAFDFAAPIILLVLASNTAGFLTLAVDPATFYVGSAEGRRDFLSGANVGFSYTCVTRTRINH